MPAPDDELRRLAGDRLRALLPALEQVQDSLSVPGQSEDQIREHGYASIAAAADYIRDQIEPAAAGSRSVQAHGGLNGNWRCGAS
ncbi:hypothetical protein IU487_33120 [Nocardia puris]|uniref:hypothetical protein n=1 Tax=Nocardia puris TaxID=208602 RepID=UPI0001F648BC|nr:hypothetical protein [Nocardia puris]EFV90144.1 hypothetical protein ES5_17718 [Dietzia cinnamea P4]MBF6215842.1 hypothetical protein [Nocardia puris]